VHAGGLRRQRVGDLARSVRAVVVDDQHLERRVLIEDLRDDQRQVLRFVVRRQDHDRPGHGLGLPRGGVAFEARWHRMTLGGSTRLRT